MSRKDRDLVEIGDADTESRRVILREARGAYRRPKSSGAATVRRALPQDDESAPPHAVRSETGKTGKAGAPDRAGDPLFPVPCSVLYTCAKP
jgi:hypothetical protein